MQKVLLDSDLFSEILVEKDPIVVENANRYLGEFDNYLISAMTYFESRRGLVHRPKPRVTAGLTALLQNLDVIPVRKEEAELAATIHGLLKQRGREIGDADPIIAATAISTA